MEKFVTYQQAVALKEIGYDKYSWFGMECSLYKADGKHTFYANGIGDETYISAPLKSEVFKWFRDKHQLFGVVLCDLCWNISGGVANTYGDAYDWDSEKYNTYEEAESACIDTLIEIVKKKFG